MKQRLTVAVFGSSSTDPSSTEWAEAHWAGGQLARHGWNVMTGGYGGTMEAASKGAAEAGGHVIGVTAPTLFPGRSGANPWVHELIEASSLANRIDLMMQRSDATIALPGSIGTAAELLIAWNTNHILRRRGDIQRHNVAVGPGWKTVGRALVDVVGANEDDVYWAETVEDGVGRVLTA